MMMRICIGTSSYTLDNGRMQRRMNRIETLAMMKEVLDGLVQALALAKSIL